MKRSRTLFHALVMFGLLCGMESSASTFVKVREPRYGVTFWVDSRMDDPVSAVMPLQRQLHVIFEHFLFKDRLPQAKGEAKGLAILIDGDWKGAAGYWAPGLRSPEGEPAVLLHPSVLHDPTTAWQMLVHELAHLLHFLFRPHEENWVQEGMALMAEYLVSGTLNPVFSAGFSQPETSLVGSADPRMEETDPGNHRAALYGHQLQYFYYLYRLCGGSALVNELITSTSRENGARFIDDVLGRVSGERNAGICGGFDASFRAFQIARFDQDLRRKEGHVLRSAFRASVRTQPFAPLPPFSATAYRAGAAGCAKEDLQRDRGVCLRIRGR